MQVNLPASAQVSSASPCINWLGKEKCSLLIPLPVSFSRVYILEPKPVHYTLHINTIKKIFEFTISCLKVTQLSLQICTSYQSCKICSSFESYLWTTLRIWNLNYDSSNILALFIFGFPVETLLTSPPSHGYDPVMESNPFVSMSVVKGCVHGNWQFWEPPSFFPTWQGSGTLRVVWLVLNLF